MAPRPRWLAAPAAFAWTALAWWIATATSGTPAGLAKLGWALAYLLIFIGGWLGIPLLGVGATFGQPFLPKRWRSPVRGGFIAWLTAWMAMALALWWLGAPPGFDRVPV